jgi:hypothetical protein
MSSLAELNLLSIAIGGIPSGYVEASAGTPVNLVTTGFSGFIRIFCSHSACYFAFGSEAAIATTNLGVSPIYVAANSHEIFHVDIENPWIDVSAGHSVHINGIKSAVDHARSSGSGMSVIPGNVTTG